MRRKMAEIWRKTSHSSTMYLSLCEGSSDAKPQQCLWLGKVVRESEAAKKFQGKIPFGGIS